MKRIIFVGLHNKPYLAALHSSTKTGKLIKRIIDKLPDDLNIVRTNLFDIDHFPDETETPDLIMEWYWTHLPTEDDLIILLGQATQMYFETWIDHEDLNIIKVAHPASRRSHKQMDEYVDNVVELTNPLNKRDEMETKNRR